VYSANENKETEMKTQQHGHSAKHTTRTNGGTLYEVCECGATRVTPFNGTTPAWHTCTLCTHSWSPIDR
jgi:hypothetical protein